MLTSAPSFTVSGTLTLFPACMVIDPNALGLMFSESITFPSKTAEASADDEVSPRMICEAVNSPP